MAVKSVEYHNTEEFEFWRVYIYIYIYSELAKFIIHMWRREEEAF